MQTKARKSPTRNPFETLNEWDGDILGQTAKNSHTDFSDQLLTKPEEPSLPKSGDLMEGKPLELKKYVSKPHEQSTNALRVSRKEQSKVTEADPGIRYHEQFKL